ncbi:MAG: DUF4139 domain-containing protein [Planctomycetes bacterium]|nr:DUF4139 domain-containing protein [Planctomycetota bacterium]
MTEVAVTSRVVRAEVYARGAQVTRRLELSPEVGGAQALVVAGVSAHAVPSSLRATVEGPGAVRGVRSRLVRERTLDPAALERQLEEARQALRDLEGEVHWLRTRRERLERIAPRAHLHEEELEGKPRPTRAPQARIADALAVQRLRGGLLEAVEAELATAEARLREQSQLCARLLDASSADPEGRVTRTVTVELDPDQPTPRALEVSYVVPTARWWPAYTARLEAGGQAARWQLEAFVCQVSGEDWEGVELSLATSDLISDASFPELPAQRLGRRRPTKRAFRAPPEGLDALFAAFDRDRGRLLRAAATLEASPANERTGSFAAVGSIEPDDPFEPHAHSLDAFGGAPPGGMPSDSGLLSGGFASAMPLGVDLDDLSMDRSGSGAYDPFEADADLPAPAPMPEPKSASRGPTRSRGSKGERSKKLDVGGGGRMRERALTREGAALGLTPEPDWSAPEQWLDFDGLELQGVDGPHRGRLRPAAAPAPGVGAAQRELAAHQPPGDPADPLAARGSFDHRFVAAAPVDVPSGLSDQRVRLSELHTAVSQRLRCVPVVEERVYREAELINPCDAPLLAGPVEVFFDDAFLTRTRIEAVPRGGAMRLGLGEEERVRVVRRVTTEESAQGFLSGTTLVDHRVTYEVASQLGVPVTLELLDRVPLAGEDQSLEVLDVASTPVSEPYPPDRKQAGPKGGRRFVLALEPGASATCELRYRLSFSAKLEVEGGNARA